MALKPRAKEGAFKEAPFLYWEIEMDTATADYNRYRGWCDLIDDYANMNTNQKKKAKQVYKESCDEYALKSFNDLEYTAYDILAPKVSLGNTAPKGETPMHVSQNVALTESTDKTRRMNYFTERLYAIRDEKTRELRKAFGLDRNTTPRSFEEFVERIKKGEFTFDKETAKNYNDEYVGEYAHHFIKWLDPKIEPDKKGYGKAQEALEAAYAEALDLIWMHLETDGEKALKALHTFMKFKA